jgi:hypothetical protein
MKPFRLKHKLTGLYYIPLRDICVKHEEYGGRRVKSNLSKKGKIYFTDPRKHIGGFSNHTRLTWIKSHCNWYYAKPTTEPFIESEWELEFIEGSQKD